MSDKKRLSKTTTRQFNIMVDFISNHKEMVSGKLSRGFTLKKRNDLWESLTQLLNAERIGPQKTNLKWRRTWSDFKTEVKNRVAEMHKQQNETGEGSPIEEHLQSLSPLYERVANLIAETSKDRGKDIEESDREVKTNSPKPSTSNDADAGQNSVADSERHPNVILDNGNDDFMDILIETEQEQLQKRESPIPHASNYGTKKKANQHQYSDVDVESMVDAEKKKAAVIDRLAEAIEERNLIEAEKLEKFNTFLEIFSSFVNKMK